MKPSQLRTWARKYGTGGLLLAGFYLILRSLWIKRRATLLIAMTAIFLLASCLWHRFHLIESKMVTKASPIPRAASNSPVAHGGTLAYIREGDIYLQQLPDGYPKRLTADGKNACPHWSPTGEWLAFIKGDQLWVMRRSGEQARKIPSFTEDFVWSPVEDTLAYYEEDGLCVIQPGSRQKHVLVPAPRSSSENEDGPHLNNTSIAWSTDGHWLAYVQHDFLQNCHSIWCLCLDGSQSRQIYQSQGGGFVYPTQLRWFPDSRHLLFWAEVYGSCSVNADGTPLLAISSEGSKPQSLAGSTESVKAESVYDEVLGRSNFIAFSPNGRRLAIAEGGSRFVIETKRIRIWNIATGSSKCLEHPGWAETCPAWAPDSNHLAYISGPVDEKMEWTSRFRHRHLWYMAADGSGRQPLTHDNTYEDDSPCWLSDGQHILFVRHDRDSKSSLWLIRRDGTGLRKIIEIGGYSGNDAAEDFALWIPQVNRIN